MYNNHHHNHHHHHHYTNDNKYNTNDDNDTNDNKYNTNKKNDIEKRPEMKRNMTIDNKKYFSCGLNNNYYVQLITIIFWGGAYKSALWSPQNMSYRGLCSGGGGVVIVVLNNTNKNNTGPRQIPLGQLAQEPAT